MDAIPIRLYQAPGTALVYHQVNIKTYRGEVKKFTTEYQ